MSAYNSTNRYINRTTVHKTFFFSKKTVNHYSLTINYVDFLSSLCILLNIANDFSISIGSSY